MKKNVAYCLKKKLEMSWSAWQRYAPVPPSPKNGPIWSTIDPIAQVCTEVRNAPNACAQKVLQKSEYVQPKSCIARGYTRQLYDPEVLQSSYMFQTQRIDSPCNIQHPIYLLRYMP